MRALITSSLLLCLTSAATAMDPPAVEWEKTFGACFYDVWETTEGNLIVGALDCVFLTDPDGDIIWSTTSSSIGWFYSKFEFAIPLSDGGFMAGGVGKEFETSSYSIPIIRLNANGDILWSKGYGYDEFTEYAFDAIELPDGGFAIAARKGADAWILRTDSQGDTLWTREWGWEATDRARGILCIDSVITVLCSGRLEGEPGGTHIVRFSLDGDLLSDYRIPEMEGQYGWDMCRASDGGLLIVNNYHPNITHTDIYGNYDWHFGPPGMGSNYGHSVSTTMDGGILFGGENTYSPPGESKTDYSGMISRHDSLGNELWRDYVYNSGCIIIYSARQLSQGGYIAAGFAVSGKSSSGFLIKYAPELGIEDEGSLPSVAINTVSPNPVTSSATIEFSLIEDGEASLTLYDLNGRVVEVIIRELFSEGQHTMQWTPGGISSGCYLLRLSSANGSVTRNVVFLK